jgi:hypothetical protein
LFQARNLTYNCTESVNLFFHDGTPGEIIIIDVQMAECPALVEPCSEDFIQNVTISSCVCEPIPQSGMLIDPSETTERHFGF